MERGENTAQWQKMGRWGICLLLFLAFMWICTILSKSIYVSALPRVQAQTMEEKFIEHIIEVQGIIEAGGSRAVHTLPGLRVESLCVQEGERVESGSLLLTIDLGDLASLIETKEAQLTRQRLDLSDRQARQLRGSLEREVAVLWATEDYEAADRDAALAVQRAREALERAEKDLEAHLAQEVPRTDDSEREEAWDAYHDWKDKRYDMEDKIREKEREIASLTADWKELDEKIRQAEAEGAEQGTQETEGSAQEQARDEAERALKQAEKELQSLQDRHTQHERAAVERPDYTTEEAEYDNWQAKKEELEDALREAKEALEDADCAREHILREKMREIASAQLEPVPDSGITVCELEIQLLEKELHDLYALREAGGKIWAENGGFVSQIQIQTGERTGDSAALLLTDENRPCQFTGSITKEEGRYLHRGDRVELKLGTARLEVTADYLTENASGGYDIVCRLPEGVGYPGMGGTIRRAVQGEAYQTVIPVEAVVTEKESCYVYTLHEKSGILGPELYVEKIKVRVLDQNETFAALVPGSLSADTRIVTFTSKELKQGETVREGK